VAGHRLSGLNKIDQASSGATRDDGDVNAKLDTFAAFLDVLAADLDDHEARAEERAARLHLSRYHFDLVIRATAGEPPSPTS
jgi:hypothetical protein